MVSPIKLPTRPVQIHSYPSTLLLLLYHRTRVESVRPLHSSPLPSIAWRWTHDWCFREKSIFHRRSSCGHIVKCVREQHGSNQYICFRVACTDMSRHNTAIREKPGQAISRIIRCSQAFLCVPFRCADVLIHDARHRGVTSDNRVSSQPAKG